MSALQRLKERKLVQWTAAYLAGAWLALEVFGALQEGLGWSPDLFPVVVGVLAVGLVVTLVLAWYHGEQGRQRVSGPELLIIGGILLVAAMLTPLLFGPEQPGSPEGASAVASSGPVASPFEGLPGIAIMPFDNRSRDPRDSSFTGGIRDELAMELSGIEGLKVITETSAYEDTPLTDPAIGAELGVQYLLRGSVQRAADSVRIYVRLIETEHGSLVWNEDYRAELSRENLESLFEIQETIVLAVAGELSVELSSEERARLARDRTDDPEAYDLYLRASWLDSRSRAARDGAERSIDLLERAVDLDSSFVDAWALLSSWHSHVYHFFSDRTSVRMQRARETAERAVDLDPTYALAQLAMADYYSKVEKDWERSLEWLERSAGTLQGDAWYHASRAVVERRSGSWEAALGSWRRAVDLAPSTAGWTLELGITHLLMRHFDEAERWFAVADSISGDQTTWRAELELMRDGALSNGPRALRLHLALGDWARALEALEGLPDPIVGQTAWAPRDFYRGIALRGLGREGQATEAFTRAVDALQDRTAEVPDDPRTRSILGMAYAALGRAGEARENAELAVQLLPPEGDAFDGIVFLFGLAVTYTWLGDHERAIDVLDGLLSVPGLYTSVRLENHAYLADLHDDPRFQEVMDEHRAQVF